MSYSIAFKEATGICPISSRRVTIKVKCELIQMGTYQGYKKVDGVCFRPNCTCNINECPIYRQYMP